MRYHVLLLFLLAALVVVIDALTKTWLVTAPNAYDPKVIGLKGILAIAFTSLAFLPSRSLLLTTAAGLMVGGGIGNVLWGTFGSRGVPNPFAAALRHGTLCFNAADVSIFVGIIVMAVGVTNYVITDHEAATSPAPEKG